MLELLLIASAIVSLVTFLSHYESRLRTVQPAADSAPTFEVVDIDVAAPPLPIVSKRARCACSHALERHGLCAEGQCGCRRFNYAGGLVEERQTERPQLRLSA